jgi:condensin complex subunit 2
MNEIRGAASPMRKMNQNKHNRAASESPRTPRSSAAHDMRRRISRGLQNEPNSPGQLDVIGGASVTPMKRVPILANFEEWMKMATDNKINAANSWNFALIDYFHDMSLLKEGDGVNFQKASCTLDGCVKIYTSRVDSVATETGRLLSGLADSADGKGKKRESGEDDEEGDDDADDVDEDGNKKKQRKKPAKSHEATLAPSFASLQLKKLELEFSVDPLFKKASADFDEGGAKGLLLNHLSIDSAGRIVFDSSDDAGDATNENEQSKDADDTTAESESAAATPKASSQPEQAETETEIDLGTLASKFFPDLSLLDDQDICPSMKTFALGSSDMSLPFLKAPDDWREKTKEPSPPPALDAHFNFAEQSGIFLHDAAPTGFDDDEDGIGGFDMNMADNVGFGEGGEAWAREAAIEGHLRPVAAEDGLDDSPDADGEFAVSLDHRDRYRNEQQEHEGLLEYFSKAFNSKAKVGTKAFVTLENWRIQRLQKARASEGPEGTKQTRTRKEKEPFFIDFESPISESLRDLLDATPVSNSQISLPKNSWRTKGRNLLDRDDEMVDVKKLMRLWIKPRCRVGRRKNGKFGVVDEGYGARGLPQLDRQDDEVAKGDYDANFFAEGEDVLPYDVPLPFDDDDDDGLGFGIDEGLGIAGNEDFVDAREMLSPGPDRQLQGDLDATLAFDMLGQDNMLAGAEAADGLAGSQQDDPQNLPPGSFGSQLVTQAGRRLRPEYVNYARTAKKVDVRRLKENMWKGMSSILVKDIDNALAGIPQPQPSATPQAGEDVEMTDVDSADDGAPTPEEPARPVTPRDGDGTEMRFTQMISDLQKVYPSQQMKDISTSYCFICLLHLANEKGLVLQGDAGEQGLMQEIVVRRDGSVGEGYEGE